MKKIKTLLLLAAVLTGFAACSETEELPEFHDWQSRNAQFIDSIANVAHADKSGDWKIFLDGRIPNNTKEWPKDYYVYCQVIKAGDGTASPLFTDTVELNYQGRLIPSKVTPTVICSTTHTAENLTRNSMSRQNSCFRGLYRASTQPWSTWLWEQQRQAETIGECIFRQTSVTVRQITREYRDTRH